MVLLVVCAKLVGCRRRSKIGWVGSVWEDGIQTENNLFAGVNVMRSVAYGAPPTSSGLLLALQRTPMQRGSAALRCSHLAAKRQPAAFLRSAVLPRLFDHFLAASTPAPRSVCAFFKPLQPMVLMLCCSASGRAMDLGGMELEPMGRGPLRAPTGQRSLQEPLGPPPGTLPHGFGSEPARPPPPRPHEEGTRSSLLASQPHYDGDGSIDL